MAESNFQIRLRKTFPGLTILLVIKLDRAKVCIKEQECL